MRKKALGLQALLFSLLYGMFFSVEAKDMMYTEKLIVENLWESNPLNLTRRIETSMYEEGFAVLVPTDLLVSRDCLFIFNPHGKSIVKINKKGNLQRVYPTRGSYTRGVGFKDGSLYYKTAGGVKELVIETGVVNDFIMLKSIELIGYDQNNDRFYTVDYLFKNIIVYHDNKIMAEVEVNEILKEQGFQCSKGHRRFIKSDRILFPWERKSVEVLDKEKSICDEKYTQSIIVLDINAKKIKEVIGENRDFGYYIIGTDMEGRIYSTSNLWANRILIHNKNGGFIMEIKPNYTKYGTAEDGFEEGLVHPIYVTEHGEIFIMMRMKEGIFIVKYIPHIN